MNIRHYVGDDWAEAVTIDGEGECRRSICCFPDESVAVMLQACSNSVRGPNPTGVAKREAQPGRPHHKDEGPAASHCRALPSSNT